MFAVKLLRESKLLKTGGYFGRYNEHYLPDSFLYRKYFGISHIVSFLKRALRLSYQSKCRKF